MSQNILEVEVGLKIEVYSRYEFPTTNIKKSTKQLSSKYTPIDAVSKLTNTKSSGVNHFFIEEEEEET